MLGRRLGGKADSDLIGRPVGSDKRELIIGCRSHGCIALYRYLAASATVFVLVVRSQREAGYAERDSPT